MLFAHSLPNIDEARAAVLAANDWDEARCVPALLKTLAIPDIRLRAIAERAAHLIKKVRDTRLHKNGLDAFLGEYNLSSAEGITLMCLAEALLRIPDAKTVDKLIHDKLAMADWAKHSAKSHSWLVNATTWCLLLTGKLLHKEIEEQSLQHSLRQFLQRSSAPIIRRSIKQAMGLLGHEFVMGETIAHALKRSQNLSKRGYCFSYDMLGEAACTKQDAERYLQSYYAVIEAVGKQPPGSMPASVSIKLSALHPRYEFKQYADVLPYLSAVLTDLAIRAQAHQVCLTIDAEEAERLDLSLDVIEQVFSHPKLRGWEGFGIAVQAYQKSAPFVIDWLINLARRCSKRIRIRLVKGAYWDFEIKNAQVKGLLTYPVFTRKVSTDVSYLACVVKLLNHPEAVYPEFATHNAYTVATILELAGSHRDFEFQCLHGMGYALYDQLLQEINLRCRVYAPIGGHKDLLSYLIRRLLENGANTSFVKLILDPNVPIESMITNPVSQLRQYAELAHPKIPLPIALYGTQRKNSLGIDLARRHHVLKLDQAIEAVFKKTYHSAPIIEGQLCDGLQNEVYGPYQQSLVGHIVLANEEQLEQALASVHTGTTAWNQVSLVERAHCLKQAAELLEQRMPEFIALLIREGGKTTADALSEVREAIDFCRYYAQQAILTLSTQILPGPTGESNQLSFHGRGVVACISPWNFPLAIFMGQITAALVAGNTVIAKPASQTTLIAASAVRLLYEAGIPYTALVLLPSSGRVLGSTLIQDARVKGVVFTGSSETARAMNQMLAQRLGPIIPFIAETGGQNAMIVDSSALLEQAVADILVSAFSSAGQRCSALRVVFVQEEIAETLITLLCGAMAQLRLGDPGLLSTDMGPVIDAEAKRMLQAHVDKMQKEACLLYQLPLPETCFSDSNYFAPCLFELERLDQLTHEVFGPILHLIRYRASDLDELISAINAMGYGLTLGVQSRIATTIERIMHAAHVGNQYVNRSMIGAVVGTQPFGGEGLSGTGPKAGGPYYLIRLCVERCLSINTTASGGNTALLTLED